MREIWVFSRTFVQGSTTSSKVISVVLVSGFLLYTLFPSAALTFALIPDRTLPSVWNLVTAGYFEMSPFSVAFDTAALMLLGRRVEPIWGASEFVKFIMVVNVFVGCSTFSIMYILYVLTRDNFYLYAKFGGFHGVIAGLLVAVKQLTPEEELIPFGPESLRLRSKHFLGLYVLGTLLWCIVSGGQHHHIGLYLFVLFGVYIGWMYLRYFQVTPSGVGDPSAEFAFETLFPEPMQPVMMRLGAAMYTVFCKPVAPTHSVAAVPITPAQVSGGPITSPGQSNSQNVEDDTKRRARSERGARLLEARLSGAPGPAVMPVPSKLPEAPQGAMKRTNSVGGFGVAGDAAAMV